MHGNSEVKQEAFVSLHFAIEPKKQLLVLVRFAIESLSILFRVLVCA